MGHETAIRAGFFALVFLVVALFERLSPRRELTLARRSRWTANLALIGIDVLALRLLLPAAAVGAAIFAREHGLGALNQLELPGIAAFVLAILLLDLSIYLQHLLMHRVPILWRLHRVHHADLDFDVTTGARFHTVEILLSMLIKFAVILLLGPPAVAVVVFEVVLNATAMFNHGNVRLPQGLDRLLRLVVVTPDMHRVHHSVEDDETNSNFGFNLPWWDYLFGTYRAQPRGGHEAMTIGIRTFRADRWCSWLPGMLAIPFVGKVQDYAINRRQWAHTDE